MEACVGPKDSSLENCRSFLLHGTWQKCHDSNQGQLVGEKELFQCAVLSNPEIYLLRIFGAMEQNSFTSEWATLTLAAENFGLKYFFCCI